MENLLSLTLEAHNAGENHHRHYAVMVGRDLFNDWTVSIRYGRTGQAGRETRYAASREEAMRAIIRDRLRRRLSAPKRIGCPYRLATFSVAPGFDAAAWLPGEIMAKFFQAECQIAGKKECHLPGKLTSRGVRFRDGWAVPVSLPARAVVSDAPGAPGVTSSALLPVVSISMDCESSPPCKCCETAHVE